MTAATVALEGMGVVCAIGCLAIAIIVICINHGAFDFVRLGSAADWYAAVLEQLNVSDRLLDVGVGNAAALSRNSDLVIEKDLHIVGIDDDSEILKNAIVNTRDVGLFGGHVTLHPRSIYNSRFRGLFTGAAAFNAVYFSGSLTLLPDPGEALRAVGPILKDGGVVFVTQSVQKWPLRLVVYLRPLRRFLQLTDMDEMRRIAFEGDMEIADVKPLPGYPDGKPVTPRIFTLRPLQTGDANCVHTFAATALRSRAGGKDASDEI